MNTAGLEGLLRSLGGHPVLVVGDVMLDEYLIGSARRVSPEAPVLVVDVERTKWAPGGAANVAANVRALGGDVSLVGMIGDDEAGRRLSDLLEGLGVDIQGLVVDKHRATTLKTRILAGGQQVVRVDHEKRERPDARMQKRIAAQIDTRLDGTAAMLASDYDKGMMGQTTQDAILRARQAGIIVTSNPKPRNLRWFHNANLVTLNQSEAEAASGETIEDTRSVERAGQKILDRTEAEAAVITRGAHGMSVLARGRAPEHIPVMPVEVFDVAGAGDTVVSTLTLALAAGADIVEAARLANFAGASVVRKSGVQSAVPAEIAHLIREASERTDA